MRQHNRNGHLGKSGCAVLLGSSSGARAGVAVERCSCTPEHENRVTPLLPTQDRLLLPWGSARLPFCAHPSPHIQPHRHGSQRCDAQ